MPENKEWSAVTALLNEINELKERVKTLEMYTWVYMTRWMDRTSDAIWYSWSYTSLNEPIPIRQFIRDSVSYRWNYEDDTIYAVTDDNIRVPIFTHTNSNVEPRTVATCRSAYH